MTEIITTNNLTSVVLPTKDMFKKHQVTFNQLVETYPFEDSGEWKYLQDGYNYLDIYLGFLAELEQ